MVLCMRTEAASKYKLPFQPPSRLLGLNVALVRLPLFSVLFPSCAYLAGQMVGDRGQGVPPACLVKVWILFPRMCHVSQELQRRPDCLWGNGRQSSQKPVNYHVTKSYCQ